MLRSAELLIVERMIGHLSKARMRRMGEPPQTAMEESRVTRAEPLNIRRTTSQRLTPHESHGRIVVPSAV